MNVDDARCRMRLIAGLRVVTFDEFEGAAVRRADLSAAIPECINRMPNVRASAEGTHSYRAQSRALAGGLHTFSRAAAGLQWTGTETTETAMMREDRERLRDALGDAELARLMEQGRRLSIAEAITFVRAMHDSLQEPPHTSHRHASRTG